MSKETVLKEFEALKGVGKVKATLLYKNGFDSMEKLKKATVKDLMKIKGITEKNAQEILAQVKEKKGKPAKKPAAPKKPAKEIEPAEEKKEEKKPQEQKAPAVEIVEEEKGAYKPKIKPELNEAQQKQLVIRRQIKKRTPHFLREEGFRYKRIPKNWRRPTGMTSKMRINLGYRPNKVRVGFRAPKLVRGLHPSGFHEVIVHTVKELDAIDPKTQAVRIGSTVGTKKRLEIAKKASERDIRLLNMKE
jgi:large subunit ribosomal protein L32e